jgi:4-amino-4-deoxy-L-arabinose transferase-like glycosyltransferase
MNSLRVTLFQVIRRRSILIGGLLYLLLFGYNTLTHTNDFSDPDTMNFVDVARNIVAGRGISQSALGFNVPRFAVDASIPIPMTSQPPLHPLLIALLAQSGLSCVTAALLLSMICYGLILLLAYRLAFELYGPNEALLSLGFLLLYAPLRKAAGTAFSEPDGLLFAFGCLLALLAMRRDPCGGWRGFPALAGLLAGLAFATRYALAPLCVAGFLFVALESRHKWADLLGYTGSFSLLAGAVLARNFFVMGEFLPQPNPSEIGLRCNISQTAKVLMHESMDFIPSSVQPVLFGTLFLLGIFLLLKQRRLLATLNEVLIQNGRYLVPLFAAGYLVFLVVQRTLTHFDYINWRMVLPAGVMLCLLLPALLVRATGLKRKLLKGFVAVVLVCEIGREVRAALRVSRPPDLIRCVRLDWIRENTTERDLIIGMDTVDVVFGLLRQEAVSISRFPYSDYLEYEKLIQFCDAHFSRYRHIYLILPPRDETDFEARYGPFLTGLVLEGHPCSRIVACELLADGETVYEIAPPADPVR